MRLHKINIKLPNLAHLAPAFIFLCSIFSSTPAVATSSDPNLACTDLKFVFARGSGVDVNSERDFIPFKANVDAVFADSGLTYSFYELGSKPGGYGGRSYPAPGIGVESFDTFTTSLGALFSGGEMTKYGESVETGADEALTFILQMVSVCPNTKIILAGYSQGAQVVSRTLQKISQNGGKSSWIYSALTFGDPKLYLPEGKLNPLTLTTPACREGKSTFSPYRAFVPDCSAYQGILGGYVPYSPSSEYNNKLRAYCQWQDVICSSYINFSDIAYGHASYDEQGTYLRAAQDVYRQLFPDSDKFSTSPQDVAILFDNTASMTSLLAQFQSEAIKTANQVIANGGRVALYTYGDLEDSTPRQLCNFSTCTQENLIYYIQHIYTNNGGDDPESLLSASLTLMRELKWQKSANKSIVVLTDAGFHNPDRDGTTLKDVVSMSLQIDPVNLYILTTPEILADPALSSVYNELARRTDGGVYSSDVADVFATLSADATAHSPATDFSYALRSSTPEVATISNLAYEKTSTSSLRLSFATSGVATFVSLGDFPVGITTETSLEIFDLDLSQDLTISLSPISASGFRSAPVSITIPASTIPKAPNTGTAPASLTTSTSLSDASSPAGSSTTSSDPNFSCTDIKVIFARGSGSVLHSNNYQVLESAFQTVFSTTDQTLSFYELGSNPAGYGGFVYPAPGVGIDTYEKFQAGLAAIVSGGEAYTYGASIETGSSEAKVYAETLHSLCPNTKIVITGYSQGAHVVSRFVQKIADEPDLIYAALAFGDPKLYLPEGKRDPLLKTTYACRNEWFSPYRAFVPDCYAYQGILGGYNPYQPSSAFDGKLKLYCHYHDVICSAYIDLKDLTTAHMNYRTEGTFLRGAEDVYNMLYPDMPIVHGQQNVAILFDNTASMTELLYQYQAQAIEVAESVLNDGGRVALYTYGDLEDSQPRQLCNFSTCNLENIKTLIQHIYTNNGGDDPESLLSASLTVMNSLDWDAGFNKSIVVISDAGFHNPDRDGVTLQDVVSRSLEIDPVNIYVLTTPEILADPATASAYDELSCLTAGGLASSADSFALSSLGSTIRSTTPPTLYSYAQSAPAPATTEITSFSSTSASSAHLAFSSDAALNFLTLNDALLGYLDSSRTSLDLTDLDPSQENTVCLSPVSASGFRSDPVCATLSEQVIPKAPNTGVAGGSLQNLSRSN